MKKQFRDFESAREFARLLNLKGTKEWFEYCKSGNKPNDIPSYPNQVYKKDFKGYGDWLGTGTVAPKNRVLLSFKDAREFVQTLKLKSGRYWREYTQSGNKPEDIPSTPSVTYKNKGWKNWGDWLGTEWRSFEEARKFARELNLKGQKEWQEYCASGNKPKDIPASPNSTYKKDFKGMGDFLGTGTIRTQDRIYRPFKEAREFVQKLGLKNHEEWKEYCKSGNRPNDIPSGVEQTYKKDFKGMGDFLGTGTISNRDKVYRTYKEAREFARLLNLKGQKEWQEYCKSGNKPDDIPADPNQVYKKDFKGYGDWLGTEWRSFEEAREFVRSLGLKTNDDWKEYCKSGKKPDDIPAAPWRTYKEWKKK
jgi:hypothetical protein